MGSSKTAKMATKKARKALNKKKKVDSVMDKKRKGRKLNPVDRSKLRKLKMNKDKNKFEKKPALAGFPRKRPSSISSQDSANSGTSKRMKMKRVSFAQQLEQSKSLDSFDDSLPLKTPTIDTPARSILRRQEEGAKKMKKNKMQEEKKSDAAAAAEQPPEESPKVEEAPVMRGKQRPKLQVTKKIKEKLLAMPRKERKAFILQLKAKRRPNFETATQCKLLWEKIRSGKTPKDEKDGLIHELCGLVKGKAKSLVYAHDTSRVIECLMSLDRPGIRTALFEELKPEIVRMAKSKYARFFVWKMLKYGSPQQRSLICEAFRGHVTALLRQTFGSEVLELAYNDYANAQQRSDLITELYGREYVVFRTGKPVTLDEIIAAEPLKKAAIIRNLEELLKDIVIKPALKHSITHRLLNEFLSNCSEEQRVEMIDAIKERLVEIIHTRDGSQVAQTCIWHATAKERKAIVKSFKGLAVKTCLEEYGRNVLMAIFDTVDDTVLVKKFIIQDIANDIRQVVNNKHGIKVIHYLCHPRDPRHFVKQICQMLAKGDGNPHSKKEAAVRYAELWQELSSALLTYFAANMRDLIFDTATSLLILSVLEASDESNLFERKIDSQERLKCYEAIAEIGRDEFIPCNMEERFHLVEHHQAHFVLGRLLQNDKKLQALGQPTLSSQLALLPTEQLAAWTACNKGCFILVQMFESEVETAVTAVRNATEMCAKRLHEYSSKGANILLTKVGV